jgi:hypothetical protein
MVKNPRFKNQTKPNQTSPGTGSAAPPDCTSSGLTAHGPSSSAPFLRKPLRRFACTCAVGTAHSALSANEKSLRNSPQPCQISLSPTQITCLRLPALSPCFLYILGRWRRSRSFTMSLGKVISGGAGAERPTGTRFGSTHFHRRAGFCGLPSASELSLDGPSRGEMKAEFFPSSGSRTAGLPFSSNLQ